METKKGYKVLLQKDGELFSCNTAWKEKERKIEKGESKKYDITVKVKYELNKYTERPTGCGSLAVFDTLKHAIAFAIRNLKIYECDYIEAIDQALWSNKDKKKEKIYAHNCPQGTQFAEKVKITKEVKYE